MGQPTLSFNEKKLLVLFSLNDNFVTKLGSHIAFYIDSIMVRLQCKHQFCSSNNNVIMWYFSFKKKKEISWWLRHDILPFQGPERLTEAFQPPLDHHCAILQRQESNSSRVKYGSEICSQPHSHLMMGVIMCY